MWGDSFVSLVWGLSSLNTEKYCYKFMCSKMLKHVKVESRALDYPGTLSIVFHWLFLQLKLWY